MLRTGYQATLKSGREHEHADELLSSPPENDRQGRLAKLSAMPYSSEMQAFDARPPPLTFEDGVIRVAGTRVSLESVVYAFDRGASPEEIIESYPTLDLASTYATLAYVLQNRGDIDQYMAHRRSDAAKLRTEIEQRFPQQGLRARLLARRAAAEPRTK